MTAKKEVTPRYLFDTATYVRFLDRKDFKMAKYNDISLLGFSCFCNKPMNIGDVHRVEINLKMISGGLIDDIHPHVAQAEFTGVEKKDDKTIYQFKFVEFAENCFDNLTKAIGYLDKKENLVALNDFADDNVHAQETIEDLVSFLSDHIKSGKIPLPVLPAIVEKINNIIDDPNAGTDDLAYVVETDAVICAKILSIANSAFYNTTSHINSIKEAVLRLGTREIQTLAITIANKSLYKAGNKVCKELLEQLWYYSLATACNAGSIASHLRLSPSEKYFTIGMVHNIGQTLLLKVMGEMIENSNKFSKEEIAKTTERYAPKLSAALLKHWEFPEEFIRASTLYKSEDLNKETDQTILIVNAASSLAKAMNYGLDSKKNNIQDLNAAGFLDISPQSYDEISEKTKIRMDKSADSFN